MIFLLQNYLHLLTPIFSLAKFLKNLSIFNFFLDFIFFLKVVTPHAGTDACVLMCGLVPTQNIFIFLF